MSTLNPFLTKIKPSSSRAKNFPNAPRISRSNKFALFVEFLSKMFFFCLYIFLFDFIVLDITAGTFAL